MKARAEAGCLSYRFYLDIEDPNAFSFVEEWQSCDALYDLFEASTWADCSRFSATW